MFMFSNEYAHTHNNLFNQYFILFFQSSLHKNQKVLMTQYDAQNFPQSQIHRFFQLQRLEVLVLQSGDLHAGVVVVCRK